MHPDLPRLLEVQRHDQRLAELGARADALAGERAELDATLERDRNNLAAAERAAADAARRRDEAEQKLEVQRGQHERRRQRLETERNPRVAAQLLADVELGRNILAREESDWLRLADEVTARDEAARAARELLAADETSQAEARAGLVERETALNDELASARGEREEAASHLDRVLRTRYDRLRNARKTRVLVPVVNATCTACFTAIPRSRIGKLQAEGILIDGCEMCGAIIYLEEAVS